MIDERVERIRGIFDNSIYKDSCLSFDDIRYLIGEHDRLAGEIEALNESVSSDKEQRCKWAEKVKALEAEVSQKAGEIDALKKLDDERRGVITCNQLQLSSLGHENRAIKNENAEFRAEVERLNREAQEYHDRKEEYAERLSQALKEVERLRGELDNRMKYLPKQEGDI